MAGTIFERTLATAATEAVFSDVAIVGAMLEFEAALADAEAAEGLVPAGAAAVIVAACRKEEVEINALVAEARSAGALAIPLVLHLKARVAASDAEAARYVHFGSTSQDVIDTAMVLATRQALGLIEADLDRLVDALLGLARKHLATPMLARTLMQPAQVASFGLEVAGWVAPLVRTRARLRVAAQAALQVQLGGAVGTLDLLGDKAAAVAKRVGERLGLAVPAGAWHTQRDDWVALGCAVAVLCGCLGKIGRDLALLAQAEIAEVAESKAARRVTSSAMPHKRNPVAAMAAIAAATRAPHLAATLLAAMPQEHQRGLGNWQAELATWPALFMAAHGAVHALAEACAGGLEVDAARMRANIDAHHRGLATSGAAVAEVDPSVRRAAAAARAQLDALSTFAGNS